jgi:hypothetical protein
VSKSAPSRVVMVPGRSGKGDSTSMKYMLLIYGDERRLTPAEMEHIYEGHRAYGEAMTKAGVMRGGAELQASKASTVRFRSGKPGPTMDGPFAETKEQLGGFYIIETDSLESAADWAAKMPGIADGAVEIRPLGVGG